MLSLVSLLPFLASAEAYFILSQPILETTRLDPIVNPGTVSGHVHTIAGGSNFNASMTLASSQAALCTTAGITVDHSNYWIPQLYYYNPNTTGFQAIPASYMNAYYLPRGNGQVHAFPDGLRMISGNPDRRTFDPSSVADTAISFVCLDYSGQHQNDPAWAQRNSFFEHNCPQGLRMQVNFPNCWDGVNIDSPDHKSHMAFNDDNNGNGNCPASHPVQVVELFYEFIFPVQNFPFNAPGTPTWVLANGDTTGYGMHADFMNGWPSLVNGTNVLQRAINECNADNGVGGVLSNCPPFAGLINNAQSGCRPQNPLVNEDVGMGHEIPALPGNNPLWIGNGTKPSTPGFNSSSSPGFTTFKSIIPSGWNSVGCIAEGTTGRALSAYTFSSSNMSLANCIAGCAAQGYPLAGAEYSSQCFCDFKMQNGASNTTFINNCNMQCSGNTYDTCGGPNALSLYVNDALFPAPVSTPGWNNLGCYTEATSTRALSAYSFSGSNMTIPNCLAECGNRGYKYGGVEYSSQCFCGNTLNSGSVPATSGCNMACSGDKFSICGGPNRLNMFQAIAAASTTAQSGSAAGPTAQIAEVQVKSSARSSTTKAAAATSTQRAAATQKKMIRHAKAGRRGKAA